MAIITVKRYIETKATSKRDIINLIRQFYNILHTLTKSGIAINQLRMASDISMIDNDILIDTIEYDTSFTDMNKSIASSINASSAYLVANRICDMALSSKIIDQNDIVYINNCLIEPRLAGSMAGPRLHNNNSNIQIVSDVFASFNLVNANLSALVID